MHPQEIIARRLYELLNAMSDERPFVSFDKAKKYEADTVFADRIHYMYVLAESVIDSLEEHSYFVQDNRANISSREEDT